jgi:hypothetical protein
VSIMMELFLKGKYANLLHTLTKRNKSYCEFSNMLGESRKVCSILQNGDNISVSMYMCYTRDTYAKIKGAFDRKQQ